MKHYIDFINSNNLSKNKLVKNLDCSLNEAKILQFLSRALLDNQNSFLTIKIIEQVFGTKGVDAIKYLKQVMLFCLSFWVLISALVLTF